MKFSIITPSHKETPYLRELYESILKQTNSDWEWVLWLNGSMTKDKVKWIQDPRVRIYRDKSDNNKVGYHKHRAFMLGKGEILVEADHDDILTPDCLEKLAKAYENPEIGFVASNNAKLHYQNKFVPYNTKFGWRHKRQMIMGKELWVPQTFAPTSHSMSYIWFAPDHVRTWRTSVYRQIGGHNVEYDILDDQDLMIRTYLVTKFHLIEDPLYIYRIDGNNTWLERGERIQKLTIQIGNHWQQKLAERDADLNGKLKVDIGGGINGEKGYMTIDQEDADICCDLNEGIPLEDNSVGVLNASHVLEHLRDPIHSMREIHRVLHHGGWAFIEVPSTDGRGAFQDPTHVSFWNENSFWYYTKRAQAQFIRNKDIRFQSYRNQTLFLSDWWKKHHIPVTITHLVALKDHQTDEPLPRYPGAIDI